MSRLDQNGSNPRTVVPMGPSVDKVREAVSRQPGEAQDLGPIQNAASYGKRVQARRAQSADALKGKGKPLGGAPPLDPEKMRFIADGLLPKPSFDVEPAPPDNPDSNPNEEQPSMVGGVGSAYRINQEMARGNVDKPVSMRGARQMAEEARKTTPARKPLSPETLAALELAQKQSEPEPEAAEEAEPRDPKGLLKADATEAELEQATARMVNPRPDLFDFDSIQSAQKSLTNPERRKKIESRLDPLDISDMIVKREIQQSVPVVPAKLVYQFRTFNQHENLFCLRYVYDFSGSVAYVEELLNTCKLVCALVAVNGALLPDHRKGVGTDKEEVDKDLFQKKMFHVANLPVQLIADLSVNAIWFNERVTTLFSMDNLKNG